MTADDNPPAFLNVPSLIRSPYESDGQFEIGAPRMPLALGDTGVSFLTLTKTQYFLINQWFNNKFKKTANARLSPGESLDKNVMTNLLGGRFSPGIDVTFIVRDTALWNPNWKDPNIGQFRFHAATLDYPKAKQGAPFLTVGYTPHREDTRLEPGDICKFMAHRLQLVRHIARQLGESGFLSETFQVYPCPSFRLDVVHGDDWAAIGDSAQSYDPISAQGIYKAVSSGIQIAKLMAGLNGDLTAYGDFVDRQYSEYLNLRKALYAREQRWVKSPFWSTRHAIKPD